MIDTSKIEAYNKLEMLTGKKRLWIQKWFHLHKKSVLNQAHFDEFLTVKRKNNLQAYNEARKEKNAKV